ncbi:MAG TPA: hypothetical protein VF367_00100 [Candidatus Limnocylindria bacterium]
MPTRSRARSPEGTDVLDRELAAMEAEAVVLWRGEALPFAAVPERIARTSSRAERDALAGSYREVLEAMNPRYEARQAAWSAADPIAAASAAGHDPAALVADVERFVLHAETPYFAALRRNLALIDIEQGDATEADLWHVVRGAAWAHWFGDRDVTRAVAAAGGDDGSTADEHDGWRAAERRLAGAGASAASDEIGARVAAAARRTLVGSPEWLRDELGVSREEVPVVADHAAFVRLWRLLRDIGRLRYELRLFAERDADPALGRAYYTGILSHITGVLVPDAAYLHDVPAPFASATDVEVALLAAMLVERLEARAGTAWWSSPASGELLAEVTAGASVGDVLARLGYDALDWRPVLRQIRTRLIGEMSGYGGPNITTRAGTRKV